ncbi:ABC transporter permease subunit [Singulisphaera sp. PoT]|uniref:ABC transporter permease subunit n=1 Tax=Singulisphaera sp. PoT TaxID=3411797 RepID=UPI003BF5F120
MAISIVALWHAGVTRGPGLTIPELTVLNALIVTLGFLLVAVGSPTALAEERVRGSLDILLSTPLSTRSILLGKWRGAYRIVPWLTVFPMASAIAMVCLTPTSSQPAKPLPAGMMAVGDDLMLVDRGLYLLVALSQTLSMGAVITSLGLALATWTSRVGRAIAANVAIYLVFAVLWPLGMAILAETLDLPSVLGLDVEYEVLFAGGTSPFVDALGRDISLLADLTQINRGFLLELEMAWSLIFLVVAYLLFEFSVRTFDRRLGRIPDRGAGRRSPARLPKLARPTLVAEPAAQASR